MASDTGEDEGYAIPHNARNQGLPPPPGKGRVVIGPNSGLPSANSQSAAAPPDSNNASRRRLPNRPQMPVFPQGQRALPGTNHIYGNVAQNVGGMPYISNTGGGVLNPQQGHHPPGPQHHGHGGVAHLQGGGPPGLHGITPNSAFLTNLANKRILNNANNSGHMKH